MSAIKRALEEILFCELCEGRGWQGWLFDEFGHEFSFEPCECNPHKFPSPKIED